jgi:hypothetical protein
MKRVDFTYWPETGAVEWHGHDDLAGDGPLLAVPAADVQKAIAAFNAEVRNRNARAAWFDRTVRGCH